MASSIFKCFSFQRNEVPGKIGDYSTYSIENLMKPPQYEVAIFQRWKQKLLENAGRISREHSDAATLACYGASSSTHFQ